MEPRGLVSSISGHAVTSRGVSAGLPHLGGPEFGCALLRAKIDTVQKKSLEGSCVNVVFCHQLGMQDPLIFLELHRVCPAQSQLWDLQADTHVPGALSSWGGVGRHRQDLRAAQTPVSSKRLEGVA